MIETIIKCDKCGKPGAESYSIIVGKEMDISGNGYTNNYEHIDLCFNCLKTWIKDNDKEILEN